MSSELGRVETLGEWLRKRRETQNLTIEDVARQIVASPNFVRAFEENDYLFFPAKVYAIGFLKKLLALYHAAPREEFLKVFEEEWSGRQELAPAPVPAGGGRHPRGYLTPRHLIVGSTALFLILFSLFLGSRLTRFVSSPRLLLEAPAEGSVVEEPLIPVRGRTEKESRLTVNGRELKIDGEGVFDEKVEVLPGRNTLEVLVENRFGKKSEVVRNILVR